MPPWLCTSQGRVERSRLQAVCIAAPVETRQPGPGQHRLADQASTSTDIPYNTWWSEAEHTVSAVWRAGLAAEQPPPVAEALISHEALRGLEAQLNEGPSVAALRRFNQNLRRLTADNWRERSTLRLASSGMLAHGSSDRCSAGCLWSLHKRWACHTVWLFVGCT